MYIKCATDLLQRIRSGLFGSLDFHFTFSMLTSLISPLWIGSEVSKDIRVPQMGCPDDFSNPLSFPYCNCEVQNLVQTLMFSRVRLVITSSHTQFFHFITILLLMLKYSIVLYPLQHQQQQQVPFFKAHLKNNRN